MQDLQVPSVREFLERARTSVMFRGCVLFAIVIALQIPILAIAGLTSERDASRNEAERNIAALWGQSQSLRGPFLVIPFEKHWVDAKGNHRTSVDELIFSPESLNLDVDAKSEVRYRGIYELPVYTAKVGMTGSFSIPDLSAHTVNPNNVLWDKSRIVLGVTDTKSITNSLSMQLGNETVPFDPGGKTVFLPNTVSAAIPNSPEKWSAPVPFNFDINFRGSQSLSFHPAGANTKVQMSSDWGDPSFFGSYLPSDRKITKDSFQSQWEIPYIGRNYPKTWSGNTVTVNEMHNADFGVSMIKPVNAYTMSERALKYEFLFTCLTFITLLMCEVMGKIRIHPIQYIMVGAALCMFYLLTLSLSEHVGYGAAYSAAAGIIVFMNGAYLWKLAGKGRTGVVVGVMVTLYGFLYTLLTVQDYSLVIGSVALTAILGLIMFLTRNIDWYNLNSKETTPETATTTT